MNGFDFVVFFFGSLVKLSDRYYMLVPNVFHSMVHFDELELMSLRSVLVVLPEYWGFCETRLDVF